MTKFEKFTAYLQSLAIFSFIVMMVIQLLILPLTLHQFGVDKGGYGFIGTGVGLFIANSIIDDIRFYRFMERYYPSRSFKDGTPIKGNYSKEDNDNR